MDFVPLFEGELRYTALESLDYEAGGQLYGTMEGEVTGERLTGSFQLTNLAQRRSDNVNCPTLRGLLTTDGGATAYVEWNGLATLRPADEARVFDNVYRVDSKTLDLLSHQLLELSRRSR